MSRRLFGDGEHAASKMVLPRRQTVDVDSERHLGLGPGDDLKSWFIRGILRDQEKEPSVERLMAPLGGKADSEPELLGGGTSY
jgi:hypothetical protein